MSNPWQQIFEYHREEIEENYIAEKYGQHKGDEAQETQALYDLRNKLKNMGKDAVVAYLRRSKMSPERKARLAKELGISIAENFDTADIQEVAPPGSKYERMVKHIKGGYKEGGLSKKEKSIAYATAWKAKNKEKANEEFESLQEESKILVRVTKEDGSVFQKKIPASQLADYRSRYKAVVVVGGSEQSRTGVGTKSEEYVNEADKKKTHRWWDDDGDGIGYEKGEVSGKFKKKKKVKEQFSDWRSENPELSEATKAQKSVEGKGPHAAYDNQEGDKKKRKKKSSKSECDCSHEVKEAAEILAQELGGELVEISESALGRVVSAALQTAVKTTPKLKIGTEPAGKLAVRTGSTAITKFKPKPATTKVEKPLTPLEKAEIERLRSSSIKDNDNRAVTLSTGRKIANLSKVDTKSLPAVKTKPIAKSAETETLVKLDTKTGAITGSATKTGGSMVKGGAPPAPPTTPPRGPGGAIGPKVGGGSPIPLPKLSARIIDPVPQARQFKV